MPFLFVQLANYCPREEEPCESPWAELREAQLQALSVPKTGMAVAIDLGDAEDVHPKRKKPVGHRLALAAMKIAYGGDLVCSGPIYESMSVEDARVRLRFRHVGGGLVARGEGAPALTGFAVAGEDRRFVWAKAIIEGSTVVVQSDRVPRPVAARYGWANNPRCNLYNAEGLPASPFRTDDWPAETAGSTTQ
jgi:sialate O-acetylesterase